MSIKHGTNRYFPRACPSSSGNGDTLQFAVGNIAALVALDDDEYNDGTIIGVASLNDGFQIDKNSVLPIDGITVVATHTGVGRWLRKGWTSPLWTQQVDWYIDPAAGNDESDGNTALTALETHAELMRRLGNEPLHYDKSIYLIGAIAEPIVCSLNTAEGISVEYIGQQTSIDTGTLTDLVEYDPDTGTLGKMEDNAIPVSWTASGLVGELIEVTSLAGISVGWVASDLGSKEARYSPFTGLGPLVSNPYEVFELLAITEVFEVQGVADVRVRHVKFAAPVGDSLVVKQGYVELTECAVISENSGIEVSANASLKMITCKVSSAGVSGRLRTRGEVEIINGFVENWRLIAVDGGSIGVTAPTLGQDVCQLQSDHNGTIKIEDEDSWYCVVSCTQMIRGGALANVEGKIIIEGTLWGRDNPGMGFGAQVDSGGIIYYNQFQPISIIAPDPPNAETLIAGVNRDYADLPIFDASTASGIIAGMFVSDWVPGDDPDCILWSRTDQLITDLPGVSAWGNLINGSIAPDFTQPDPVRLAIFHPNGGPNNHPYIEFDGVNDFLVSLWAQIQPVTIFAVVIPSLTNRFNQTRIWDGGAANRMSLHLSTANRPSMWAGLANVTATADVDSVRWQSLINTYAGVASIGWANNVRLWEGNPGADDPDGMHLAVLGNGLNNPCDSCYAEVAVFGKVLSTDERRRLHRYSVRRYGELG